MKIAILTQPLYFNYGGILQAYALYHILQDFGHEVWIINRVDSHVHGKLYRCLSYGKFLLKDFLLFVQGKQNFNSFIRDISESKIKTFSFVSRNISNISKDLYSDKELIDFVRSKSFDAFVVGSDQVWRPLYSPNIYTYFLDFVDKSSKKISYAASFGVDMWDFTKEQTLLCSTLIQKFNAVSVREKSGVTLCKTFLKREDVTLVLDPTLLYSSDFYLALIRKSGISFSSRKHLLSYILDKSKEKEFLINQVLERFKAPLYVAQLGCKKYLNRHVKGLATIEEWLYGFANAEFAIVDSFHGCVFSLIFHVPFIVIANDSRGVTRFKSLLSLFNLESRLLESVDLFTPDMLTYDFPWEKIDGKKEELRKQSLNFLLKSLI